MAEHEVTVFKGYPFRVGEQIRIDDGPRAGDWEVIGVSKSKVRLRCPVSKREFQWDRFCYIVETKKQEWPRED